YERLAHTSLMLLNCVPLALHGREEWRLVLDGNITCWVQWWQYVLIAYNIVFVIPFLLVLLVGTSKLERQKISALQFVAACFVPLPFLIYWMLRRCFRSDSDDDRRTPHQSPQGEEKRKALLGVLQGPFRPPDSQSRGASYWESILIGRRLVFLCLYSFISTPMLQMLLMTAVCIVILVHNIVVRPYKDQKAHLFGVIMLSMHVALAIINLCKSVLHTVGVTPTGPIEAQIKGLQLFEVALLGALPLIFVLLILLTLLSQITRVFVIVLRFFVLRSRGKVRALAINSDNDNRRPLLAYAGEQESLSYSTGSEVQEKDCIR
ncbi:uncharacterized protein LOC116297743, partial [Actinia tenebrosa]|uniref:Uncharacterized protein LOC116297743 n=1 Tax=Actinia tenebrosa TaxID=6105 RepID=A0A6P8I2Z5_ACTTE